MPLSRTLSLFLSLSSKEKKELNLVILTKKKKSLHHLHKIVSSEKKRNKIQSKEELFPLVMDYKYTKTKDFLLRNEIRLYNIELKKIISNTHFENNDFMQDAAYVSELETRKIDDILSSEINKKISDCDDKSNYQQLDFFLEKLIALKRKSLKYESSDFYDLKEILNKSLQNKLLNLGEEVSKIAFYTAYTERVLFQLTQKKAFTSIYDNQDLFSEIFNENLAFLNCLKAKAYQTEGIEKIKTLEKTVDFLETTAYIKIDKLKDKVITQQRIATEYMLLGKYKEANKYYMMCFENKDVMDQNLFQASSHNYISSMLKAKEFEKANLFILENELNNEEHLSKRMLPVFIICFILAENLEAAENLMPKQFDKQNLDFYHYLRVLQCIIFYENNLLELAENEAENLKRHLDSFKDKSNDLDNVISEFLIAFVKIEFNQIEPKKTEKRNNLKKDLMRFSEQNKKFDSDGLVLLWLKKKLSIE